MYLAAAKAGIVTVPINARLAPEEMRHILDDSETSPAGGVFRGYERREVGQAILGYAIPLGHGLGARSVLVVAEAGGKEVFRSPEVGHAPVWPLGRLRPRPCERSVHVERRDPVQARAGT